MENPAQPPAHPPVPWPGLSADQAFVVPLLADCMATPWGDVCETHGLRLVRKQEFHVTVLSHDMARTALRAWGEVRLRDLYLAQHWAPQRTARYALLHKQTPARECWSVIEHLHLPAMLAFRNALADELGSLFDEPVPHVTHFVLGDANGIGVPDKAAFAAFFAAAV